jgi:hypothetical protein
MPPSSLRWPPVTAQRSRRSIWSLLRSCSARALRPGRRRRVCRGAPMDAEVRYEEVTVGLKFMSWRWLARG